jgi:hypothetical protein
MSLTIQQLPVLDALQAGDALPVASLANGDTRRASLTALAAYLQTVLPAGEVKQTQYASPTATGYNVAVTGAGLSKWLIVTAIAAFAAGGITLPAVAGVVDGQEVLCSFTQAVGVFTLSGNGAGVSGAPSSIPAGYWFRVRFDAVNQTWYRCG